MKIVAPTTAIPTHIISGFLGAGKTTLLTAWLAQKPENEVWAVLMNEFGQIGIDQNLLPQDAGYAVKELLGGCLCCSSQLPMQLALARLLSEHQPDRLFIEPTGLGHPAQLLEQLTEPQWQQHLTVMAPITVLDGSRLHLQEWQQHELYRDQMKAATVIVLSHHAEMHAEDFRVEQALKAEYAAYQKHWLYSDHGQLDFQLFDRLYVATKRQIQPLLRIQRNLSQEQSMPVVQQLPYHYVESGSGYSVAGWKLPKSWQFDFYALLDLLCEQKDWRRIKAIFFTDQGWKSFNFNPDQFNYQDCAVHIDNRIEIIYLDSRDWASFEAALFACQVVSKT